MEDVCAIDGGGGDRKLKPHYFQHALKCPRCDSLDTKFCYYNNYNQSQPRHFCKSCRRYWTKGGVLRNVPVGGGIRKTSKRSKPRKGRKSKSHSSSKNSGLSASTTTAAEATSTSATGNLCFAAGLADIFPGSNFYDVNLNPHATTTNPSFDSHPVANRPMDGQMFTDIERFTSLENMPGFHMDDISTSFDPLGLASIVEIPSSAIMDQTVHHIEFEEYNRISDGGLVAAPDWENVASGSNDGGGQCGDEGPFDFIGTVDQGYWSDQFLNNRIFHN